MNYAYTSFYPNWQLFHFKFSNLSRQRDVIKLTLHLTSLLMVFFAPISFADVHSPNEYFIHYNYRIKRITISFYNLLRY